MNVYSPLSALRLNILERKKLLTAIGLEIWNKLLIIRNLSC